LDGSELTQLSSGHKAAIPVVSPDGQLVAFAWTDPMLLHLSGDPPYSAVEPLPPLEEGAFFLATGWSPDGTRILGVASAPSGERLAGLLELDRASGSYRRVSDRLFETGLNATYTPYLADGLRAIAASAGDLFVIDLATGRDRLLLPAPPGSRLSNPRLAGNTMFYLQAEEEADLWVAELEPSGS
jgi:hypothetical protein